MTGDRQRASCGGSLSHAPSACSHQCDSCIRCSRLCRRRCWAACTPCSSHTDTCTQLKSNPTFSSSRHRSVQPLSHICQLCTFTCDSVSSVTIRAASTPEGPSDGGLTGNTGVAGRVGAGHVVRGSDAGAEVRVQLLYAGRGFVDSGAEHSGWSLVLY